MAKTGPIILVEDDPDDKEIFEDIVQELRIVNKISWFTNSRDTYIYLKTTTDQPFLIFCDINLPKQNGLAFKKQIDDDEQLRKKSIPFVFYSTAANQSIVNEAYTKMTVQGFFKKANSYSEMKDLVKVITDYWQACKHPNTD